MDDRPKGVGLGGSLSARSASRAALNVALEAAAEHGAETALFDARTMDLFVVRALRGIAVPLVAPVARADRAFDESGQVIDEGIERQLRALGREVAQLCIERRSGDAQGSDHRGKEPR